MNQSKAFCPGCKKDVVFESIGNASRRCPLCGFQFELSKPGPQVKYWESSGLSELLMVLCKVALVLVALVVVGLAVAFAGCALMLGGGMH